MGKFEVIVLSIVGVVFFLIQLFAHRLFGIRGDLIWGIMCFPIGYYLGLYFRGYYKRQWLNKWREDHPNASDEFLPEGLRKK